ncbi:nuclear transport factor 2 family protein [Steroidobacter sp. S1-65]|uniref:Nuclear transport factor 2 family protein n=1 Tax=Steroidobacter gossypii TaxID=2805490 RepID=A0ABS1X1Z6_9GAMM|nr:nuclear transport factor 2 family protein [Steroidobacter gossypii]MBM0107226.1 nuclear transport factor 2 family protein [Steroidobacter gossypii]
MNTVAGYSRTMLTLGALLGVTLGGCGSNGNDRLPKAVVQSFEQCFNADDLDKCVNLFDDDAQILPERGPAVAGREGIEAFLKDQMTPVVSFNTESDMSLVRNDIAIEQGHYKVRDVRRGSDVEEGKYMHVWRNRNGDWKLYRVMYNTDVAPDTAVSVAAADQESEPG